MKSSGWRSEGLRSRFVCRKYPEALPVKKVEWGSLVITVERPEFYPENDFPMRGLSIRHATERDAES